MKLPLLGEFKVVTLRECPPDLLSGRLVTTPEEAASYWRTHIVNDPRFNTEVETLMCLAVSTRRHILGHYIVATGTLDTILAHPREVFRPAVIAAAAAIVLMHNHPSGDPTPSEADIKVTRDMIRGGQLLKIDVLDHVIMGRVTPARAVDYVSLRELGYFYS